MNRKKAVLSFSLVILVFMCACTSNRSSIHHESPPDKVSPQSNAISALGDGVYQYESTELNSMAATDLVLEICKLNDSDLNPIFMHYDAYYTDDFYGYILGQSHTGPQIITTKLTCIDEEPDYYLVRVYEDILDDVTTREGHQATTELFAVMKNSRLIIQGADLNPLFQEYLEVDTESTVC